MATTENKDFTCWLDGEPVIDPKIAAATDPIDFFADGEPYEVVLPASTTNPTYRFFFGF